MLFSGWGVPVEMSRGSAATGGYSIAMDGGTIAICYGSTAMGGVF